jgi:hypothetical protein
MDKETFYNNIKEVKVPKEDVLQSIKLGVNRAAQEAKSKKSKPIKKAIISATVAAGILVSSSLIVPSFSKVLADAPMIGGWYAGFNDIVGRNLEEQNLVTKLNQTYSSQGVDVALTSAYYDGYLIGITFDVKGQLLKDQKGYYYALYELFNGDPHADETKELTTLEKTKDGFSGHIRIVYPYKDLPKHDTIPVSFEEIGKKKGNWQFDVPVQQNPVEEHVFTNKESTNLEGNVLFHVDSVLYGKASTAIIYRVTYPKGELESSFTMLNVESLDKSLKIDGFTSDGQIDKKTAGNSTTVVRKIVFSQVLKNKILVVSPSYGEIFSPVQPLEIELP